jgi:hypothetical protein
LPNFVIHGILEDRGGTALMNVSLSPELEQYINKKVEIGGVVEILRILHGRRDLRHIMKDEP